MPNLNIEVSEELKNKFKAEAGKKNLKYAELFPKVFEAYEKSEAKPAEVTPHGE